MALFQGYHLSSTIFLLLLSLGRAGAFKGTCDDFEYGKPKPSDCNTLFDKVTSNQILTSRLFVEEQLRKDEKLDWPGIDNPFNAPVVQLPKYYSLNTCNFALMPYTHPKSRQTMPSEISNWGSIKLAGNGLMQKCLTGKAALGGEIFVTDSTSENPVLAMYMWQSGSRFEDKLNMYETYPLYSPQLLGLTGGLNATNGINGTSARATNLTLPPSAFLVLPSQSSPPTSSGQAVANGGDLSTS